MHEPFCVLSYENGQRTDESITVSCFSKYGLVPFQRGKYFSALVQLMVSRGPFSLFRKGEKNKPVLQELLIFRKAPFSLDM